MTQKVTLEYDDKTKNLIILDVLGRKLAEIHTTQQYNVTK